MLRLPTALTRQIARPKRSFRFVSIGLPFLGTLACGGGGGSSDASPTAPVVTPVVTTVSVTLASSSFDVGETTTASVKILDQNGSAINGKTVVWSSDNQAVATVTSAGVITGVGVGTANVIALIDGKQGQATGTVTRSPKFILDATVFTNADFGNAVGPLADVSVLPLKDGRFRMFLGASPGLPGLRSAISTDNIHFAIEPGIRAVGPPVPPLGAILGITHPFVMRLDDGRVRLFSSGVTRSGVPAADQIFSLTSSDEGVTFTVDPGFPMVIADSGYAISGPSVVKVKSGGWRVYYGLTSLTERVFGLTVSRIGSAFSTDMNTWKKDPGVRIGAGSTLTGSSDHPGSVVNDDGSITLVYWRPSVPAGFFSTSSDGLTFTTETSTGFGKGQGIAEFPSADSFVMRLANGDVRMFFNWGDDKTGAIYTAHRPGFSLGGK